MLRCTTFSFSFDGCCMCEYRSVVCVTTCPAGSAAWRPAGSRPRRSSPPPRRPTAAALQMGRHRQSEHRLLHVQICSLFSVLHKLPEHLSLEVCS
uniref:Uncharacterized protein n=1 Tax=Triticum urartu TaxID=4572 RepID=A0A8R7PTS8_TRIUA